MQRREEPTTTTMTEPVTPSGLFSKLPSAFWARKLKADDNGKGSMGDDMPLSPAMSTTSESSSAASFDSTAATRVHAMDDFAALVMDNNHLDPMAAADLETIARLAKQNEFLTQLLRKVTAKVSSNRHDMTVQHHRIQDLERALAIATQAPPTHEISCQTDLDMESLDQLNANREANEAMAWQLKIANAKVTSLSKCLQTERADHDAKMADQARIIFQLEQQLNQFASAPMPPPSSKAIVLHTNARSNHASVAVIPADSVGYIQELHSILATFLRQTIGVDIMSFSTKAGLMDLGMLKAHLKSTTFASRQSTPPPPPSQKHLVELDSIQDRVLARMEAARVFLATFASSPMAAEDNYDLFGEASASSTTS
ncbi:hypothetical protein SDRG_08152 [Saprolegnia diclina VS20]|uniref:Uncharacterized protein n=1 Tax=Saprolegnia diclina (strain VS20) TaxID=1156394 RepID=T0RVC6_SAPDV|nr:hypothetical protein SDRG_08152 [Saprolegnia diclina VS20]EQC34382.1 hypothetical protein SDRG_08152 [Saprolegnia diclina VS20]|eukprot:XP_008612244.1 hypothetical protein SDRG_08152 [Saprolegnia diclina VS20]